MQLSNSFWLNEFTRSQTAARRNIDNSPSNVHIANMRALATNILQLVRDKHGVTNITSGYRSPNLNAAIGGSTTSQHSNGEAADFHCPGIGNRALAEWIRDNLDFDQLILEFPGENPWDGWVHCSYKSSGKNRKSVLTAVKQNGKTVYLQGIQ